MAAIHATVVPRGAATKSTASNRSTQILISTFVHRGIQIMRYAALDIGTNTLLMLIGEFSENGKLTVLRDEHAIARLGAGVDKHRNINTEAIERATAILERYCELCAQYGVSHIDAVATSAVRDAANSEQVLAALSAALQAPIRCITGEEEAQFSFLGAARPTQRCTVIDIGGGSTEYITGQEGSIQHRTSLNIGAVRLTERCFSSLPPSAQEIAHARAVVREQLATLPSIERGMLIGVGGTCTSLAAIDLELQTFDTAAVHHHLLTLDAVTAITEFLLTSTVETLRQHPAIHPKRADVLPMGALILEESMRALRLADCHVSTQGLRYGVLLGMTTPSTAM